MNEFSERVIEIILSIPEGKVVSYGWIALMAGNPRGARQVARLLHSASGKYDLPWHRVVNSSGRISLPSGMGLEEQALLLRNEGVIVSEDGRIKMIRFHWAPGTELRG